MAPDGPEDKPGSPASPEAAAPGKPAVAAKPEAAKPEAAKPEPKKPEAKKPEPKPEPKKPDEPAKKPAAKKPVDDPTKIPAAPPWWKTLRADPPAPVRLALAIGLITVVFAVWWFVTRGGSEILLGSSFNATQNTFVIDVKFIPSLDRVVPYIKLPSPGEVISAWGALVDSDLAEHITSSLERVLIGVGLAAIVGVGLGVLAASHRGVNAAIAPIVIFLRSVPMGALVPLTLTLFGSGETQKTRFIFLAIVPFVFSDTVKAVSIVPERYVETALTLGASRFQIIRKVLIPLSIPDIFTSLRFQFGLALGYIMLAEEMDTPHGIGTLIRLAQQKGEYPRVYLVLFVIALVAFGIDLILRTVQKGIFQWRRDL